MLPILPHEICCAICIHTFCQKLKEDDDCHDTFSKKEQSKSLLGILKAIRNPSWSWKELLDHFKSAFSKELLEEFVNEASGLGDFDKFISLFKSIEYASVENSSISKLNVSIPYQSAAVKRTSVFGLFLRKLMIKFEKMSFQHTYQLYQTFDKYVILSLSPESLGKSMLDNSSMDLSCADESSTNVSMTLDEISNPKKSSDNIIETFESEIRESEFSFSKSNILNFVAEQVKFLERNGTEALPPHVLQQKIKQIQKLHADVVDIYYLSFLNYLRVLEVNKAKDMLGLYFDYKIFRPEKSDLSEVEKHRLMFKRFRYCTLNLGIMHCCNGNYVESLLALEEAVRVSQETNDEQCLKYAIFWLNIVKEETGQLRIANVQNVYEEITNLLYSEDELQFNNFQDIDYLGILRYSKILAFKGVQKPNELLAAISRVVVTDDTTSTTALLTRSSLLEFYGLRLLSAYNCQITLQSLKSQQSSSIDENFVHLICHLACYLGQSSHYNDALLLITFVRSEIPLYSPYVKLINRISCVLHFEQHLMHREMIEAKKCSDFMVIIDRNEGIFMSAIVDTLFGNYSAASKKCSIIQKTMSSSDSSVDPTLQAKVCLLSIEIKLSSANPTQAIEDILHLLSKVELLHMYNMKIEAVICLVRYYILIGSFDRALHYIDSVFIETLANGNGYHCGVLYYYQAKCLYSSKSNKQKDDCVYGEESAGYDHVLVLYNKALCFFKECKSLARLCDVYYDQALLYNEMGLTQDRNKASTQYRLLHEQLKDYSNCVLY